MNALDGKTIVVTGVASGIGAETAKLLKVQGAIVIGIDRTPTQEDVDKFFEADLSEPDSIDGLLAHLPAGIDGLCNIAGLPPTAGAAMVLKVNALGLKRLTLGLIDRMNDKASITNLASLAGFDWPKSISAIQAFDELEFEDVNHFCEQYEISDARSYFFSKEYLIAWTFRNRWTWRQRGIRMNCISPGPVETPILKDFLATLGARAEEDTRLMDRSGRPQDIAPVVAFLQNDASAWLRGANLTADGGMSSHIAIAQAGLK